MKLMENHYSFLILMMSAVLFSTAAVSAGPSADPFVGDFVGNADDGTIYLHIQKTAAGQYKGYIQVDGERIGVTAKKQGSQLAGEINEAGDIYEFTATVSRDGSINFTDEDGESVIFSRRSAAASNGKAKSQPVSAPPEKAAKSDAGKSSVYINRVKMDPGKLKTLEADYQTKIGKGRYWYDKMCGAWGVENGPTAGFIMAGLDLPGPMPSDISGGGTGIFINGREIHPMDQLGLQQLFGITYRGRYWLDDRGNLGVEGGPALVNIGAAIQAAQSRQSGGSTTHGYGSASGARGTLAGDGQGGHMYSGRTAAGKSVFWYPGM